MSTFPMLFVILFVFAKKSIPSMEVKDYVFQLSKSLPLKLQNMPPKKKSNFVKCVNQFYMVDPNQLIQCLPSGFNWIQIARNILSIKPPKLTISTETREAFEIAMKYSGNPLCKRSMGSQTGPLSESDLLRSFREPRNSGALWIRFGQGLINTRSRITGPFRRIGIRMTAIGATMVASQIMEMENQPEFGEERVGISTNRYVDLKAVPNTNNLLNYESQYKKLSDLRNYASIQVLYKSKFVKQGYHNAEIVNLEPGSIVNALYYSGLHLEADLKGVSVERLERTTLEYYEIRRIPAQAIILLQYYDDRLTQNGVY
eukprot:NODE_421_length_7712_cov_1.035597.p4 type:complete len:315 gc:universal NODE_421_length_7712_cov_1.035597:6729-5785(-)